MKKILLTTTESLHGWEIETYLRPVFANVVVGAGFLSDFSASVTDFFGGRSNSYEKKLQTVNDNALNILTSKAVELGANCILGLKVDMDQISGKNVQMFMVSAYGTAVVAKNLSSPKTISTKEVDKTTIAEKAVLIRLLKKIQNPDYQMTTGALQVIVDSKSDEFKDFIFQKLKDSIITRPAYDTEVVASIDKLFMEYFSGISPEAAISVLYNGLLKETNKDILTYITNLICQNDLVDFTKCRELLGTDTLTKKKIALKILMSDKPFYVLEDVKEIEQIETIIQAAFPTRATLSTKKGFLSSSEKEVWQCECGKSNPINDENCFSCSNDKYGFKSDELKPENVLEVLNNKSKALIKFFN